MSPLPHGVRAVLLDIEGTTTPLSFVTQVLFPYARAHLRPYLERHAGAEDPARILTQLKQEHAGAVERGEAPPSWADDDRVAAAASFAAWQMDRDAKTTALKELQGLIWREGYESGALVSQIFPDVAPALRRWQADGVSASIYSSGSALAQQLLFRYTSSGDLTPLLRSYFDTTVGAKADVSSYAAIADRLALPARAVLFLSDAPRELAAARQAGMDVRLMMRPGNAPVPDDLTSARLNTLDEL